MKVYKGFNKDMTCRGYQFEEGKEYTEENAVLCKSGFHACTDPLDCLAYYRPSESVYHEVELGDISKDRSSNDSKVCGRRILIGARLDIVGLVKATIDIRCEKIDTEKEDKSTGDRGASSATGNCGASSATGDYSTSAADGLNCAALSAGYKGRAKGSIGSVICILERDEWNGKTYPILAVKAAIVDGEEIKADTWYKLEHGEFVEAPDEE